MKHERAQRIPPARDIGVFRRKVVGWFRKNGRNYPWRQSRDPFRVLIAEMMLQRTKADQVKQIYEQLFSEYPDIEAVANADEKKLEQILYPLGLKWRTESFARVAKEIREKYQGQVPAQREDLIRLPGVGEYVAGIVLSVAFNKPEWAVDSNVVRIFKRYFGISTTKEGRRDKHVIELAKVYSAAKDPKEASLALLDFAALICVPKNPRCTSCPLSNTCHYYSFNKK